MIFELLHGETPWECKTEKELMDKMVKDPVNFRESLNLSEGIKGFIKKCLEVKEEQRMSLADLKEWNQNNSYESLKEGGMNYLPSLELHKKICSSKENKPVLGELTNRVASRSQSNFTYQSKSFREAPSSQNTASNLPQQSSKPSISSKNAVEKNNNIIILEINVFRLLYKIY
jgi:serine/threonine protein kinase